MPAVSVIISIRNCEDYIAECLESLTAQTFKDFEVVVVLDAPTDRTPEIVESYKGRLDLKTIHNEKEMGRPWNMNRAWAESRGEFIAHVDGDDVILPRKLEVQLAFMQRHPKLGFTGTMGRYFGEKEGKICVPRSRLNCRFWFLWCASPFLHPTIMFRRAVFEKAGLKYNEEFIFTQDLRLFSEALFAGVQFANIHRDLYRRRMHAENAGNKKREFYESLRKKNHLFILNNLGLSVTDNELARHRNFAAMNVEDMPEEVTATLEWIGKLAGCDCGKLGIPRRLLWQMLRLRWAVVVYRNCVRRRSPNRGLYFQKAGCFNPLGIWRVPAWIATRVFR
jgi:glycosyltransferase involved in cell wall biosynthesis